MSFDDESRVIVTDIRMPFLSMVIFMVKWVIASIPAFFILGLLATIFSFLFHAMLGGFDGGGGMGRF